MSGFAVWPASLPQKPQARTWRGGPQDDRAVFEPEIGAAIMRRRHTGSIRTFAAVFRQLSDVQVAAFEAFFATSLQGGAGRYLWRDPVDAGLYWWQIARSGTSVFQLSGNENGRQTLSFTAMRLPAPPWFAAHVPVSPITVPSLVLDFVAPGYGVDLD